jgi:NAD(P)-dependent dehydrogenase (short-subunit alcohol dehydrogenase family)
MKSVARQVGDRGITLNWIGVAPAAYAAKLAEAEIPHGPEMGPPAYALGRIPSLKEDVARTVALFANGGAAAFTGASINIDGGEWMQP